MSEPVKTNAQQSETNFAMLKLVRQYGSASFALLLDQFGEPDFSQRYALERFQKKLSYLCFTDQLVRTGRGPKALYTLGHLAFKPQPGTRAARGLEPVATRPAPRVAADESYQVSRAMPNLYDVMRAPVLCAPPASVLRPGALDHLRYASRGNRC